MSLRYFVTGTDTGVGKTLVAEALLQLLVEAQLQPFAFKPYESGVTRVASSDALRLWRAAGKWQRKETVNVHRFKAPLAPFHAARIEGRRLSFAHVLRAYEKLGRGPGVVEGAGGVMVPLDRHHDVIHLISALKLPVVVVARAGLGTINHTVLTINALTSASCLVRAVVLIQSTRQTDRSIVHNCAELKRRCPTVTVLGPVPFIEDEIDRNRLLRRVLQPLIPRASRLR